VPDGDETPEALLASQSGRLAFVVSKEISKLFASIPAKNAGSRQLRIREMAV